VWQKIEQVIQPTSAQPALSSQRVRLWQSLAASIAVIAIGLAAVLVTRAPEVQVQALAPAHVALVADQNKSLWLVNAYPQLGELRARALGALTLAQNQAFELWMLPDGGRAPVSLGLLPVAGEARLPLSAAAVQILAATSTLAVSLEPAGGSPTGAPTGPVLYTAALIHTQG
jgi:anti-sigma-K factor RskA